MKDEYEEIKKLLIDDIKNAQDITARSISVQTLAEFCEIANLYGNNGIDDSSDDDVETPWD